jgi:3-hydroxyisobutyrate dehydrogenase-like beta-hydroxyacid dehydrogenase
VRTIGLLHPGEMGSALGRALRTRGVDVVWASDGRSPTTAARAAETGLRDVRTAGEVARVAEVVLSVCPPHAAPEVAASVGGFSGVYVDANAVAPATARTIEKALAAARFVDGGIVGPPPGREGTTRLYLSGTSAREIAALFTGTPVDARVLGDEIGTASALKMAYAAWSKGTAAMLLAIRALARAEGVETALLEEWRLSVPGLEERLERAERSAATKGWRWIGEMEEIAAAFAAAGLPDGFHRAAAAIYREPQAAAGDTPFEGFAKGRRESGR